MTARKAPAKKAQASTDKPKQPQSTVQVRPPESPIYDQVVADQGLDPLGDESRAHAR